MKTLGLDIGTTSISAVVYDSISGVLDAQSVKNDSFLTGESWERIQNPGIIWDLSLGLLENLIGMHPGIQAIGVTGQMHGIVYLNGCGAPVSPLYTWQDGRGDLPFSPQQSWAQRLSDLTGHDLSTGYGLVTHFYNLNNGLIPPDAVTFCTIQDYIAMRLAGNCRPVLEPTNAASLGLFDVQRGAFDPVAFCRAGMDMTMLPELMTNAYLGTGKLGIPVYTAIGDNQAAFLGSTAGHRDAVLINMGTGGQVCVRSPVYLQTDTLETRPFPDGGYLLVGASLCGGRSYALLEHFFSDVVEMVTGQRLEAYSAMSRLLDRESCPDHLPTAITTFQGTRKNPTRRGAFLNISADNFAPLPIIYSVMYGMAQELYSFFCGYLNQGGNQPRILIGSGNGLRKNKHLCRIFESVFGCPMVLSPNLEEAACGAAMYAAKNAE